VAELERFPRVKVCGLTRTEDVTLAIESGAEALGFVVHAPSPRTTTFERVAELRERIPPHVLSFAVVVDAQPDALHAALQMSGLDGAQLCGDEHAPDWTDFPFPLLRRLGVAPGARARAEAWLGLASAFVLDHPTSAGGSGLLVDLLEAAALARELPCLLAGGLDGERVVEAIRTVLPLGVDASSRLESSPGVKDPDHLRTFINSALNTFAELES